MQCGRCHQELSAAEVLQHEERERELETFERSLYPYSDTYMHMLFNTKLYEHVKHHFPWSLATANP